MKWSKFMIEGGSVDNKHYQEFKSKAINNDDIVRKTVALADIDIINPQTIKYKGVDFKMSEDGFNRTTS